MCISELVNGINGVFSSIRKRFARRNEQPRRCSLTEDELEMQNMMAVDIATSSHDTLANDVIKRISEELSHNDMFFENIEFDIHSWLVCNSCTTKLPSFSTLRCEQTTTFSLPNQKNKVSLTSFFENRNFLPETQILSWYNGTLLSVSGGGGAGQGMYAVL